MLFTPRVVRGLVLFLIAASLPLFAGRRPDVKSSDNGQFGNCPPSPQKGPCPSLTLQGSLPLQGTDKGGNAVTVTIDLYDWGFYPCNTKTNTCQKTPRITAGVLDVTLDGSDTVGIESVVVKGVLSNPGYLTCDSGGVACMASGDLNYGTPEPTPIAGADRLSSSNTRWDFAPAIPPPAATLFDQLVCQSDTGPDSICAHSTTPLGEAILVTSTLAGSKLGTASSNYLVTLTDGTTLGGLVVPASPTKVAANNQQSTATLITATNFKDYVDTSQTYPQINADGSMNYPTGFTLAPLPPQSGSSPSFPSCYPADNLTGKADTRMFRTVWYTYTAPANGSITVNTFGSRYDTLVYAFTEKAGVPQPVSCDDDPFSGGVPQAATTFTATKGTPYYFVVYEAPTYHYFDSTNTLTGYPLSVDGALYLNFQFTTNPSTTTTSLVSSKNPSVSGQSVTFTATVVPKFPGTPIGTVTFSNGTTTLGTVSLVKNKATLSTSALPVGTDVVTAKYSGDANYLGSTGSITQTVNP